MKVERLFPEDHRLDKAESQYLWQRIIENKIVTTTKKNNEAKETSDNNNDLKTGNTGTTLILQLGEKILVWKGNRLDYLLTNNPNILPPHPSIKGHLHGKLKMCHVLSDHVSQYFFSLPLPWIRHIQPLTPAHWGIYDSYFRMPEPSRPSFPHLIHHTGHSHLISKISIPNHIPSSMTTYPSQYPHLWNF